MADSKLTGLSDRGAYVTGDLLYVVPSAGAAQYKGTINNLAAYCASNLAAVSTVAAAFNATSANLRVYPPVGGAINGNTTNAPIIMKPYGGVVFFQSSATAFNAAI